MHQAFQDCPGFSSGVQGKALKCKFGECSFLVPASEEQTDKSKSAIIPCMPSLACMLSLLLEGMHSAGTATLHGQHHAVS